MATFRRRLHSLFAALTLFQLAKADQPYHTDLASYQSGSLGEEPCQSFQSSPVVAPVYQINTFDADKIDTTENASYIFMAGRYGGLWGPSIVSSKDLSLVWADQRFEGMAQTAHSAMLHGERVLTVFATDAVHIFNQQYEEVYTVRGQGELEGIMVDSHEALVTDQDTVMLFACPSVEVDLTPVGGPASGRSVANCVVQEIDPVTNEVLFQFSTLDYFDVTDSVWNYNGEGVWDFCHMNSVQKTPDGNFLIGYRHLSTIILVNGVTAEVIWAMGGTHNQFTDISEPGRTAEFHFQHEPRVTGPNSFTFFDNHRLDNGFCSWGSHCSRGLEVGYDSDAMTVWVINEWSHPQRVISASRGGVQRTPGGNVLVAWGQNPLFTEYTADGTLVMDFQRGQVLDIDHGLEGIVAYRAWKGPWEGRPTWGPSISCSTNGTWTWFYVSWNGATEVDRYTLLSSDSRDDLNGPDKVIAQSPRTGFETSFGMPVEKVGAYGRIAAIDIYGTVLGATPGVDTVTGGSFDLDYDIAAVTNGKSTTITGVPSSAAVHVPAGTQVIDADTSYSYGTHLSTIAVSGIAFSVVGVVGTSLFAAYVLIKRRRAQQQSQMLADTGKGEEAAEGLLNSTDIELNASFCVDSAESVDSDDSDNEAEPEAKFLPK